MHYSAKYILNGVRKKKSRENEIENETENKREREGIEREAKYCNTTVYIEH